MLQYSIASMEIFSSAAAAARDAASLRRLSSIEGNTAMNVGIIGASFAKAAYLPALRLIEGAQVTALASARMESARAAADQFAVPHVYDDWRRMLAEHTFDLVCIATPTVTHAPMVLAALDAGAHVLAEKPTALDA